MTVAISCLACSQTMKLGAQSCPACGRRLSSDELAALEARFEAMNTDFRDAKTAVVRALAAALAAGLMTVTIQGIGMAVASSADDSLPSSWWWSSAASLAPGIVLVLCWFGKQRMPLVALIVAATVWSASLVLPLLLAPAQTILGMMSPAGVALTLARLTVLVLLFRGIPASIKMRRMLAPQLNR